MKQNPNQKRLITTKQYKLRLEAVVQLRKNWVENENFEQTEAERQTYKNAILHQYLVELKLI